MNQEPTHESTILDLFLTNKPGLVKSCTVIPGLSDHDIDLTDCNVRAVSVEKPPRVIFIWGKADWDKIRSSLKDFKDKFLTICHHRTVEYNCSDLHSFITKVMDENIPTKLSNTRQSVPWFDHKLKRMCKRKQQLFSAAKKSRKRAAREPIREIPLKCSADPVVLLVRGTQPQPGWGWLQAPLAIYSVPKTGQSRYFGPKSKRQARFGCNQ